MSFPSSPINGQLATVNGITYSYNSATNYWSRVPGGLGPVSSITVTGTASSTSTTTGAVTIAGGLGVVGNINFGGNLYQNGVLFTGGGGGSSTGTTSTFLISNTTSSTSTTTGALVVSGGVGVGGTIYAGSIVAGGVRSSSTSTAPLNATVGDMWYNTITDDLYRYSFDGSSYFWLDIAGPSSSGFSGGVVANSTQFISTSSSTSTATGAVTVTGGLGVGGTIYAGSIVAGGVKTTSTSTPPTNPTVGDIWYNTLTDDIYRYTTDGVSSYWLDFNGPTANSVNVVKNLTIAQNVGGNVIIPVAVGTLSILNNSGSTVTVPVV